MPSGLLLSNTKQQGLQSKVLGFYSYALLVFF
ncbi:hypothetical protein C7431_11091 [Pantoea allii]|uniref:Uncharacterized protein n=1 Tax=Pantoea allii TaxID=574096 RepID=A0A2V2BG00_9GAMM|nr:hypothetical protein [Pantoea ananatis]PWK94595.1 hypothetical protein C7431_11091 [Pantoea allii]MDR6092222.1 hypothetical protein [Pantoea ananatis]PWV60352.1 hypothetical protein C7425_11213 [Pantoea ananatis]PWV83897.1 hypothetical protein C7426_11286 [Pantoea ananatis]